MELEVPDVEGHYTWEVKFPKQDLEPAHAEAAGTFSFSTASPPDHQVIVSVINKDSRAPVSEALVILHPYRCKTDQHGLAKVDVPKGGYELYVSKNMYQTSHSTVWAEDGVTVVVEMLMTVPYDPDEEV